MNSSRHPGEFTFAQPSGSSAATRLSARGFTLIELLVVIAIIAVLASMLLPVLAKAKTKAQGITCMNNTKQLMLAWRLYADDSQDGLPLAGFAPGGPAAPEWDGGGWLDYTANKPDNYDPNQNIKNSPLWRYCGNSVGIWKCPADRSFTLVNGAQVPRIRSMTMNCFVGGSAPANLSGSWRVFTKLTQITRPTQVMTLLDEHEDSINNGYFWIDMRGYPNTPAQEYFVDYPASYHNGAAGIAFADGHSEIHKWLDSRTKPPVKRQTLVPNTAGTPSPNNPDVLWIQDHATIAK